MIAFLDSKPNKANYLKELIKKDMLNRYFTKFKEDINEVKKHDKETFYNEVRKKNNRYPARKLQGDVFYIKDIFIKY